jgi:hypothetical protein
MTDEAPEITALRHLCQRIQRAWAECEELGDTSTRDDYDRRYGYFRGLVDQITHDDVILLLREHDRLKGLSPTSSAQHD